MKNRRKIRVMAWILTVVMLMTSLGLDAFTRHGGGCRQFYL